MGKVPLDYRGVIPTDEQPGGLGAIAVGCAVVTIGLHVIGLMCLLCRYAISTNVGDIGLKFVLMGLAIASVCSMILSFVLGTMACFQPGRVRELGLSAIVISGIWAALVLIVAGAMA
jgi:hypothetical protein